MSVALALGEAGRKPAGKRPYFLDAEVERVLAITMAVVQELAVARERIDTLERLLEAKGVVARAEIEAYAPSAAVNAERGAWTQEYLARVLRIVQQEGEAIAAAGKGDLYSEEVAVELTADATA
jgi:gamma-glutamyl phosphate reductase